MQFNVVLDTRTPFTVGQFVIPDRHGQEVLVVVLSATFEVKSATEIDIAAAQAPIRPVDEHRGDPAASSPVYEGDVTPTKPFVDVLVNGFAFAPGGRPAESVPVEIAVGDVKKTLLVWGDRNWAVGHASAARPFVQMPIIYERALGGTTPTGEVDVRNPVGVGYKGATSADPDVRTEVPNIEYPGQPVTTRLSRANPAGLGPIGRAWKPRSDFAGTYDKAWLDSRFPLLPLDFDERHYQAAPPDQQSKTIRGGEPVHIVNMSPTAVWQFRLPLLDVPMHLLYDDREERVAPRLDTVLFEPHDRRVTMTSRLALLHHRSSAVLREIVVGHVQRGLLKARRLGKVYLDHRGLDGLDTRPPLFRV
jgi:hypothetical protein